MYNIIENIIATWNINKRTYWLVSVILSKTASFFTAVVPLEDGPEDFNAIFRIISMASSGDLSAYFFAARSFNASINMSNEIFLAAFAFT